jgi:hypothetical protein
LIAFWKSIISDAIPFSLFLLQCQYSQKHADERNVILKIEMELPPNLEKLTCFFHQICVNNAAAKKGESYKVYTSVCVGTNAFADDATQLFVDLNGCYEGMLVYIHPLQLVRLVLTSCWGLIRTLIGLGFNRSFWVYWYNYMLVLVNIPSLGGLDKMPFPLHWPLEYCFFLPTLLCLHRQSGRELP